MGPPVRLPGAEDMGFGSGNWAVGWLVRLLSFYLNKTVILGNILAVQWLGLHALTAEGLGN